jgi:hypothetical protein
MKSIWWIRGPDRTSATLYNRTNDRSKSFTFGAFFAFPGEIEWPSCFRRCDWAFTPPGNFSFKLPSSRITRQ